MSTLAVNTITNAAGGNTAQINGMTPTGLSLQGFRNRIINGDMRIDQRNAGASVTVNGNFLYPVDRVLVGGVGSAGTFTAQQTSTSTAGFSKALVLTTGTADASISSGDYYFPFLHQIEGFNIADLAWGTASAQAVVVSFWVRSNVAGTYPVAVRNSAADRAYVTTVTISAANTFEYKSVVIPGDTSGTWLTDNGTGIQLSIGVVAGTAAQTTAGAWAAGNFYTTSACTNWMATTGNTFFITGVQLEAGAVATPFERRPFGAELALCQRYYYKIKAIGAADFFGSGLAYGTTKGRTIIPFKVSLRTAPTALEQSGTASDYRVNNSTAGGINCSAVPVFVSASTEIACVDFTVASGLTAGNATNALSNTGANAFLAWSAEL